MPQALNLLKDVLKTKAEPIHLLMLANSAVNTSTAGDYVISLNESLTDEEEKRTTGLPIYSLEEVASVKKVVEETKVCRF